MKKRRDLKKKRKRSALTVDANSNHECFERFKTEIIDACCGEAINRCYGTDPMIIELWVQAQDGTECFYDDSVKTQVNFCPFCGLKASSLKKKLDSSNEFKL